MIKKVLKIMKIEWENAAYRGGNVDDINFGEGQQKNIFLLGTSSHNNLGDHAISVAEVNFLQKNLKDYRLIEILDHDVCRALPKIRRRIRKDDLVFLHGGGNMGIEYYLHEMIRRKVIKAFPDNKIVIFPQTIDYGDSLIGKIALRHMKKVIYQHKHLCIVTRENHSYRLSKQYFPRAQNLLTPDIVLSLYPIRTEGEKQYDILLCLRSDREKRLDKEDEAKISTYCKSRGRWIEADMIMREGFHTKDRYEILEKRWKLFAQSRVVITDRLHGMIFSYLTGTDCIVFSNYNHKVRGTYEWLKGCGNIYYFDLDRYDISELKETVEHCLAGRECEKNGTLRFENSFIPILRFVRDEI